MKTTIPTVHEMPREVAIAVDHVSTYQMSDGPQAGMTVVEALDAHRVVLARSIVAAPGAREDIADMTLARSPLERCAAWAIEPIGRGKRSAAMVIPRPSDSRGTLESIRDRHDISA
ncbi:hypothetical protein [Arenivirga flava]|uniref:Uncharacterized protein n=1 Tax=Arenivirga flava TaxID=1930060 RepID=A0AA37ULQ0_9MICO|nr:hypothetical protein [Arenivirga flava]GMA28895.1 hypothetical protein GCM10025874_21480 [Arenivirga flava]